MTATGARVERIRSDLGYQGIFFGPDGRQVWCTVRGLLKPTDVIEAVVTFGRAVNGGPVVVNYNHHSTSVTFGSRSAAMELTVVDRDVRRTCKACQARGAGVRWEGAFLCSTCAFEPIAPCQAVTA